MRDLAICAVAVACLFAMASAVDFLEWFYAYSRAHEDWELDEIFIVLALSTVAAGWFAYRRWHESARQLQELREINRQLNEEIDAREHAQRTLGESEDRLRQATKMARLGYYVWDSIEDRCLYCSEEHARMHGLTPEEYIERAAAIDEEFTLTHPEDRAAVQAGMRTMREGRIFEMEYRTILPDGGTRYLREVAHPVFDQDGRVIREVGVCLDITEMKRAETLLARALDVSPSLFALFGPDDALVICNQKYRELYDTQDVKAVPGVKFEALVRAFAEETGVGDTPEETAEWIANRLRWRDEPAQAYEYRRGDGEWIETTDHILDDGSVFIVASVTTERKRIEAELRQSQKMEAVGQLTGGIAHDFNNLLSIILGNAENLEDELGPANLPVQAIFRAADRGAELTQRLLAFSRRQPLVPKVFDPAELVSGMHDLISHAIGETVEVELEIAAPLWRVRADPGQLENALLNLAINARHAMPEGGRLRIAVANAPACSAGLAEHIEVAPGDYVSVTVSDTGTGMTPEVLEHAFEPFFTTKDVGEGSGLGLSMVYGFSKQSGGDVQIESEPGRGTSVALFLPRATESALAEVEKK